MRALAVKVEGSNSALQKQRPSFCRVTHLVRIINRSEPLLSRGAGRARTSRLSQELVRTLQTHGSMRICHSRRIFFLCTSHRFSAQVHLLACMHPSDATTLVESKQAGAGPHPLVFAAVLLGC